jgi:hypothetical protein
MLSQRFVLCLCLLNLLGLGVILLQRQPAAAADAQVLRGRALEIVDNEGRVRASIAVLAPTRQKDGTTSAETVLLRLITEKGRPSIKIATSEDESGMVLTGPTGTSNTYIQFLAGRTTSSATLRSEDGNARNIAP